jgi:PAS domain S-box-containing protein
VKGSEFVSPKIVLRRLMDQVACATSLDDVYESALAGLRDTLGIDRSSVLVVDTQGVMRFVAWSGLSDAYRAAVEGHSPWSPDETDAAPVLVGDVRNDSALAEFLPLFQQEHIGALACMPLRFGCRLLGKFMLYYPAPHVFTKDEIAVAETIAGYVAFAIEYYSMAERLEGRLATEHRTRERAEHEAALRQQNEERLQMALGAGQMCAWEWDVVSGRIGWSAELEEVFGPDAGTFATTVESFQKRIHPADLPHVKDLLQRLMREHLEVYEIEYRLLPPDGSLRWLASKGRVIFDREGRPVRLVGVCSDISERKRMERSKEFLAEASRVLATTLRPEDAVRYLARLVVPRLADWCIIQVVDEHGEIKPAELAHSDPEKVALAWEITRRWRVPSEHGSAAAAVRSGESTLVAEIERPMLVARAVDDEHLKALEALGLKSGITVPLKARGRRLGALTLLSAESQRVYDVADLRFTQEIAGWAALAIDNAQLHRQAERERSAAERSREFLHVLAKVGDDLASSLDPDAALKLLASRLVGKVADYCITWSCDGTLIKRTGLAHRDANKLPLLETLCDAKPPTLEDESGAGAVIRTGEALLGEEAPAVARDGGPQNEDYASALHALGPCSSIVVPLRARGRTLGAIELVTAVESQRRFDQEDLKLARELASRAALLVDNARLYAQARAAIRARDDMIAVVSHDLRSPLQSIASATAVLELEKHSDTASTSLNAIKLATTHMDRLLQDLLDISLIDTGQFTVSRELTDVSALVEDARMLFEPLTRDKSVQFDCRVASGLPQIRVDRGRMQQALSNLLGNALKFVPPGGRIGLYAERSGDSVRIAVSDTGPGIAEEDLGRVFDRFWRADRRKERGVGLGLTVAQGIVQAHGGQIGVESRKGEGSTFYILLDAVAPVRATVEQVRQKEGPVLVIDDDEPFRAEIVEALQKSGYAVVSAGDGREALEYLRGDNTPALVLLDMMMPLMNGWSLFEAVKQDPRLASVPIVLLTALADHDDAQALPEIADRLSKPVRMNQLLKLAAAHCRRADSGLSGHA